MTSHKKIQLTRIAPDKGQPRRTFDDGEIAALAASIEANGLIQPITVRSNSDGGYIIVAGERRWRAHRLLAGRGLTAFSRIGCHVVPLRQSTADLRCLQIVENIQRADMPILEEADALAELVTLGLTEDEIARRLGLAAFRVRWRLQLRSLAPDIRRLVAADQLNRQEALEVARLDRHDDQRRIVRMINRRELGSWKAVRNAVDAIIGQTTTVDLFGEDAPRATSKDVAALSAMESMVESAVRLLSGGWRDGECVIASKVNPDRAGRLADKLSALKTTIATMERELRNRSAQVRIVMGAR